MEEKIGERPLLPQVLVRILQPNLKIDPAEAYLVGLLHDIGRFVMFEHAAPNLLKVDESHGRRRNS